MARQLASLDRAHPAAGLAPAAWPENRAGSGACGLPWRSRWSRRRAGGLRAGAAARALQAARRGLPLRCAALQIENEGDHLPWDLPGPETVETQYEPWDWGPMLMLGMVADGFRRFFLGNAC